MGRGRTGQNAVYAPPRGQRSFGGHGGGSSRGSQTRHRPPANPANKFHHEDLQHFPQVMQVATKVRDNALKRGRPAMTGHARQAYEEDHLRTMTESEVYSSLRNGNIIELNDGPNHDDCRMLVRDEHGVCVVYSVALHRVITCWWNDPQDDHSTLDLSNYKRVRRGDPSCQPAANQLKGIIARGHALSQRRA